MKAKSLLLALSLTAMTAGAQGTSGIDRANMNTAVKPGNDFYEYAIGGWRKAHPLDAEHARNGSFIDLDEMNQKRILGLIEATAAGNARTEDRKPLQPRHGQRATQP